MRIIKEDFWDKSGQIYQPLKDSKYLRLQRKPINTLSLDEIKYLYVVNRAGHSFIRYGSIEKAINGEINLDRENSWDSEIFEACYDYLHSLSFPLTIYRALRPDEVNKDGSFNISGSKESRSWTTNINIYKDKLSSFRSLTNIVSAKINSNIIDNSATIVNYYFYTGQRNVRKSNYGEYEISLKKNFKQTDLQDLHFIDKDKITESLLSNAKNYFGTLPTNEWELAFYINTDGTLLDGSGSKFGADRYYRTIDHREISDAFDIPIDGYDAMLTYEKEGNIRFIPESQGFEIMKEPTEEQYNTIARVSRQFNGNCGIDFIDEYGDNIHSIEYDFARPYKIVQDIKDFFGSK